MLEMGDMTVPCVHCAPSIQVSGPQLPQLVGDDGMPQLVGAIWDDSNGLEKASWAISTLGALIAVGGLVGKKPVITKVAGAIGVIGGIGSLILAMLHTNNSNDLLYNSKNAADIVQLAREENQRSMIDVLLGGATLAANAIALLLVPAR